MGQAEKNSELYTYENAEQLFRQFVGRENRLPTQNDPLPAPLTPLGEAVKSWRNLWDKFRRDKIAYVPAGTTFRYFAIDALDLDFHTFLPNGRTPRNARKSTCLDLLTAYNSVAWHIIKKDSPPVNDDELIPYGLLRVPDLQLNADQDEIPLCINFARNTHDANCGSGNKRRWKPFKEMMRLGYIAEIPEGVDFDCFYTYVKSQLDNGNYSAPIRSKFREEIFNVTPL